MNARAELADRARAAQAAGGHEEALALWSEVRAADPRFLPAIEGVALSLLRLGRPEEVARLAENETGAVPEVLRAVLAQHRKDWPEALAQWRAARDRGLNRPRVTLGVATALLRTGRAAESVAEAEAGLARGHESPMLRRVLAEAAEGRLDLEPHTPLPDPESLAPRALVEQFQSLGENCEFGLLQRQFGAEPLGLLRFGTTLPRPLVRALAERFEGVGDPGQTEIRVVEGEYRARDMRYLFDGHTRIRSDEASPEQVHRKQSQRLGFLARMLIDQLETQSRIFVHANPDCTEPQMAALYRGVSGYGPNFLLCVRLAEPGHPAGSMAVQDRLMVGYIDRPGRERGGRVWNISVDHWLTFCRAAVARRAAMLEAAEPVPA